VPIRRLDPDTTGLGHDRRRIRRHGAEEIAGWIDQPGPLLAILELTCPGKIHFLASGSGFQAVFPGSGTPSWTSAKSATGAPAAF
jgi:hypothetical protein